MNKAAIRFLGIGLFLAGAAFQIQLILDEDEKAKTDISPLAYEQSQHELKSVKNQLAQLQLDLENAQKGQIPQNVQSNSVEEKTEKTPTEKYSVLIVRPGMTAKHISSLLERSDIIQNKQEFQDYLSTRGLSSKIRVGEYELNSMMTFEQIAKIITTK